ncbi:unnamed protein product [Closterium sp. Naga37s-1]|nr:unnamed protein product [Closterium sp. Naga37s-1]
MTCYARRLPGEVLVVAPLVTASVLLLLIGASGAFASVHPAGQESSEGGDPAVHRRSLAAATLGAPCRYGGNIMPIECSPGLKCQPGSSTAVASEPASGPNPNQLGRPGSSGAGPRGLTHNPDFATTGTCVPDDSSTSSPSTSTSSSSNATSPLSQNPSTPVPPSSSSTSTPRLGPGPLEKPTTCEYMCARGQYHGEMPCPRGYTCVLALEGGLHLSPEALQALADASAEVPATTDGSNSNDSTISTAISPLGVVSNSSNAEFIKSAGAVIPYEGICAPSQWFGPNASPKILSAPSSSVSTKTALGGSASLPAAEPVAGEAGSNCSFGGDSAAVLCNQGFSCLVEAEKRTVHHPQVFGVCVSAELCDPYLEEKIEDAAGTGSSGKSASARTRLPGLGGSRLGIAGLLFASLFFL